MALTSNYQLIDAAFRNNIPLVGVFWKDEIPTMIKDGGYIVNLGSREEGGTHWVNVWVEKNRDGKRHAVYFDPFGGPPPESVKQFLKMLGVIHWNNKQIQSIESGVCGYYALAFLYLMTRWKVCIDDINKRMDLFTGLFSEDVKKNRKILEKLLLPIK